MDDLSEWIGGLSVQGDPRMNEVRKQLRGVVEQLEASRQEADELRQEVVKLRAGQGEGVREPQRDHLLPAGSSTTEASGLQAGASMAALHSGASTSGLQAGASMAALHSGASISGLQAGASMAALHSGASTSGLHARASISGVNAGSSTMGASGLQAGATMPAVSAALPTSGVSGLQSGEENVNARTSTSATMGGSTSTAMEAGSSGHGAGDPMARLLEGLEKVIKGGKPEELSKVVEAPKLGDFGQLVSGLW